MKKYKMYFLFSLITGMLILPISAPAAPTTTTNISIDFSRVVFIPLPCAGENVQLSGSLHVLMFTTISNSNKVTIKFHFQPQGITGLGLTTGDTYQGTGATQGTTTFDDVDGFPFETTMVNNFNIIGYGPGNQSREHDLMHVTVNANGETTAFIESSRIVCGT